MSDNKQAETSQSIDAIDQAIANAATRKANKAPKAEKAPKPAKAEKVAKVKPTDEEKLARTQAQLAERTAKKEARAAAKAEKQAAKSAAKPVAHLAKVVRAGERLGTLDSDTQLIFDEATTNLSAAQVSSLAAHLTHFNRVKATERAGSAKVEAGQSVTITGGDPRYIGQTGTVFKSQRIRCYVTVEGVSKPIYLFTSDCEVKSPAIAATA
jgi:hypothetical protein